MNQGRSPHMYVPRAGRTPGESAPHGLAIAAGLAVLATAFIGPNVALVIYAAAVLALGLTLLWRPKEPPIMVFIFVYQWLQASVAPIYGNFTGLTPDEVAKYMGRHDLACYLSLTGVLALALGMRLAIGRASIDLHGRVVSFVGTRPVGFWLRLYLGGAVFSALCNAIAYKAGGLTQVLLALAQVKWAAYMLLTFATFAVPGRAKLPWMGVCLLEFALSLGGFFSSFKDIFFYAFLGLIGSGIRFRPRSLLLLSLGGIVAVFLGVLWSAVKTDYREYVLARDFNQSVNVSYGDAVSHLGELIVNLDGAGLAKGADTLAHRLMYTEFFGVALGNVPENVEHTRGALWGDAVLRTFMPRLIFSDKAAVYDSELTRQYTGINVSSIEQGTSISMGYIAEAYIDWGPVLMFVPILLLGYILGFVYRWLLAAPGRDGVIGAGLSTFTLMQAYALETSSLKMIPAIGLCVAADLVILKFIAPLIWGVQQRPARIARQAWLRGG